MSHRKILQPSQIRFTAEKINYVFDDRRICNEVAESLCKGLVIPEQLPVIRVVNLKGIYYSLDNRRLYVFRTAQFMQAIDYIPVKVESQCLIDWNTFNPRNEGKCVRFADKGEILPHWSDRWQRPYTELQCIKTPPTKRSSTKPSLTEEPNCSDGECCLWCFVDSNEQLL